MSGPGPIQTFPKRDPAGPPFVATSADNGLSVDPVTGRIVLGDDGTAPPGPAQLLSSREIFTGILSIILNGGVGATDFFANLNANGFDFIRRDGLIFGSYGGGQLTLSDDVSGRPLVMLSAGGIIAELANNASTIELKYQGSPTPALSIVQATENVLIGNLIDNLFARLQVDGHVSMRSATANLDFPNTLPFTSSDLTIALADAAINDMVVWGFDPAGLDADSCYTAFVDAPGSVTVRFNNYSAVAIDPAARDFTVSILKPL